MSTVIAFSTARRTPVRGQASGRRRAEAERPGGAEIVILPVVRIERHDADAPGSPRFGSAAIRPH
ncbi:hypothetical protein EZH22_25980 [Xanthobacter dioxanivorans]|uniref:Uncharacterized protein n=1 Tax=Xanthobacter dioxanivorans TaxID=2528964 RepID=A0A974PMJ2_9HYPH|nr:hypothetical protein [Xanthobacter dioxanivorans]QRG06362.1 hypothetical protein EZH22_25980 [Xanthobacter dioxanivorans]